MRAVVCLLIERGTPLLADALKPEEVTKRVGKSRASYYRTEGFPASEANNAEARVAVLESAIEQALIDSARDVSQVVGGIGGYIESGWVSDSPREFVRTTAEANFDAMADHTLMMQLVAGALAPSSPRIESALQTFYRTVVDAYAASYDELFRFWGYRAKPPFTPEKLAIVLMALAEGLMLRYLGDADMDRELFGELISTVGTLLLVADGDVAHESVPLEHDLPGEVAPPTRGAIIAALIRLFDAERAALPTTGELARAAGCTAETTRSHFGGVIGVVRAAWEEWTPEFEEAAERNRRMLHEPDPLTVLYRVAMSVALRAIEQPALTRALLMSEIGVDVVTAEGRSESISTIFERLLTEAATAGTFRTPSVNHDALDVERTMLFARTLRNSLLTLAVSHPVPPGTLLSDHARWCVDYTWALFMPSRGSTD